MFDNKRTSDPFVFGLDIGTRSVVGSVGYLEKEKFHVVAHCVKEHETRAMLDGQIHDIGKVAGAILWVKKELESQIGRPLTDVCIAAAGRVLKTVTVHVEHEQAENAVITSEQVISLDLLGVEKAHEQIRRDESGIDFFCVGYSVIKYYLNDYMISNLEGHKGKKIAADVLATFLPEEVVGGLYAAVEMADLQVINLTLEPIAAINVAIPEKFRLLNIALVDVGAGTSDISITKDGSIVAYGMIPSAGDEITESLVQKYLVDFNTAEKIKMASTDSTPIRYKDILELEHEVPAEEVTFVYHDTVDRLTAQIADKIMELNGGKTVSAVFVVGGGGKAADFIPSLARYLELPEERVALRGAEVLGNIDFADNTIQKDPLLVTPIGICMNFYDQKNNFIFVYINDERIKLYNNNKLTVANAALHIGFPNQALFPRSGKELSFKVNSKERLLRGSIGEPAVISINGKEANINSPISGNDRIIIEESIPGEPAGCLIEQLPEYNSTITVSVNDNMVVCPRFVQVNGNLESGYYNIKDGDEIELLNYYSVEQLFQFLDVEAYGKTIYVNNEPASLDDKVYENFTVKFEEGYLPEPVSESSPRQDDDAVREKTPPKAGRPVANLDNKEGTSEITVFVNDTPILLKNKSSYVFVDIFDYYQFDLKSPGGSFLVTQINGLKCGYMDELSEGDRVQIYWGNR